MELPLETHYFGESWGVLVSQAPTPVGQLCAWQPCAKPIKDGDQGYLLPHTPYVGETRHQPWHRECLAACLNS